MSRGAVIWVGRAKRAALAVACPTCNAELGRECSTAVHPGVHQAREDYAHVLGFRDVQKPGGLFE